jgi:hypothetical protein
MESLWLDRDGCPITVEQWTVLQPDIDYSRVARSTVMDAANPSRVLEVSTVWLGLDYSFGMGGPPLIFETMVFGDSEESELCCERYATESQAREGHTAMVVTVSAEMKDPVVMDAVSTRPPT